MSLYDGLFKELTSDDIVLTANQRMASFLEQQFCLGKKAVCEEKFLSLNAWINQLWQRLGARGVSLPIVLSSSQERYLWEKVLAEESRVLLSKTAAAAQAARAWQLMQEWQLSLENLTEPYGEDVSTFISWAKSFKRLCQSTQAITVSEQLAYLNHEAIRALLPKRLWLVGFVDISPQLKSWFNELEAMGIAVRRFVLPQQRPQVEVLACQTADAELRNALNWAFSYLEAKPKESVAIVIPDLHSRRRDVIRLLKETAFQYHTATVSVTVSGGEPLSSFPIVQDALKLLSLHKINEYEDLSLVWRSPFIGGAELERSARDQLDLYFRANLPELTRLSDCMALPNWENCPLLWQQLLAFQNIERPHEATMQAWARYFLMVWEAFAWPGQRNLNSEEYQAVCCLQRSLDELLKYSVVQEKYSYHEVLHLWRSLLDATPFQAESPEQSNLYVLGLLESGGLTFDAIWLSGLSEEAWPPEAAPSPFLPISLQRSLHMPHATSERELFFARSFLSDLQRQSKQLYLSYPEWEGEVHLNKSPLIELWPHRVLQEPICLAQKLRLEDGVLEQVPDSIGPAVDITEFTQLPGGYKLFQQQAICPFQAFAAQRFRLEAFPEFTAYLDARIRGNILHDALEGVWRQLQNQANLLAQSEEALGALINTKVRYAVSKWQARYPYLITHALARLEKDRIKQLIQDWLVIEKTRPPFTVLAQESTLISEVAGIPLKMRIDRMDQLEDGSKILLDYKTGQVSAKAWFDERPSEAQLPLYTLITKAQGLAYAKLRRGDMGFMGVTEAEERLPYVPSLNASKQSSLQSWDGLLAYWETVFAKLAEEFLNGHAKASPKSLDEGCNRCSFQSLCRIHEAIGVMDGEG